MTTRSIADRERLWFDVEKRYKAIGFKKLSKTGSLWFDVEKRYKAIK